MSFNEKLTVDKLNTKRHKQYLLDDLIRNEIREFDFKIQQMHDDGHNKAAHELPTAFPDSNDQRGAQIYVYSELISSYIDRGFRVGIQLTENPRIVCMWENKFGREELDARKKIIEKHLLS